MLPRLILSLAQPDPSATLAKLRETPALQAVLNGAEPGGVSPLGGVSQGAWAFSAAVLAHSAKGRPVLVICPTGKLQEQLQQELETWLPALAKRPAKPPLFFPAWNVLPHEARLPHADVLSERLETLIHLAKRQQSAIGPVIVTTAVALLQRTFSPAELKNRFRRFKLGQRIDPLDLVEWLEDQGYEPEAQVSQKGEIALRGGILDVFPLASPWPVRFEFFGDEIESLRTFDPQTQISREKIDRATISPGGELGILKQQLAADSNYAAGRLGDYLVGDPLCLLIEPDDIAERVADYLGQVPSGDLFHDDWETALGQARERGTIVEVRETDDDEPLFQGLDSYRPLGESSGDPQVADAQRREFFNQLHRWLRNGYTVWTVCGTEGELQRFDELWIEYGLAKRKAGAKPVRMLGSVSRGFLVEPARLVVVTDSEIFGRTRTQRPRRLKSPHAAATRSALEIDFTDLSVGDFVVHLQHGIGRYLGLKVLPLETRTTRDGRGKSSGGEECLVIEYGTRDPEQDSPKLYVPVSEAHLVSKYVGTGRARPPLSILGGKRWAKAKADAEKAVSDVAADLLKLQASREAQPGHEFGDDTPWQRELEGAFPFEETPDQWTAIEAAKRDMQQPKPMDRLVCGDVGFGKTEVAIRAAFKAVMGGKQVAVLVPTTVLAQQHFNTFVERMAEFPVSVELLSRFRTKKQADAVIAALAAGSVDVVIGTHKLVQPNVRFKDLGLVIIDEEHRFGVRQKERLKQLRQEVDILALTATPIPRTLNIGLAGLRAISLIGTPPPNRVSIKTFVRSFSMALVREACLREIHRGGQVYYLHNAVRTIGEAASRLADAVPEASIRIAHGQMPEIELERVMQDFYHQRFNILVCSTIIESGIDVPTANTIIINRADRLGLAQLHQLRGRVGRSRHQAYAFLLTPAEGPATTNAAKRLEAIVSLSQLGAGFTLASHDLEIRGAGELLGEGQSGAIDEIGFSLYTEYLTRAIRDLGQKEQSSDCWVYAPIQKPEINLEITALFPDSYLPDVHSRLLLYQRIAAAQTEAELYELQLEIVDRFGLLPVEVKALLRISVLQLRAAAIGIRTMEIGSVRGKLGFQETAVVEPIVMTDLLARNRANMSMSSPIEMRLQHDLPEPLDRLTFAEKLIGNLMGEDAEQVKLSEGLTHSERKR